jgi:hypothetical protein
LLRVADHVDTDHHGEPAFLAVITGWVTPTHAPMACLSFQSEPSRPERSDRSIGRNGDRTHRPLYSPPGRTQSSWISGGERCSNLPSVGPRDPAWQSSRMTPLSDAS